MLSVQKISQYSEKRRQKTSDELNSPQLTSNELVIAESTSQARSANTKSEN